MGLLTSNYLALEVLPFLLLALVGHVVVWVVVVNRSHAVGIPRWIVDAITVVSAVALLGIPAWAAWRLWQAGDYSLMRPPSLLHSYALFTSAVAIVSAVWRAALSLHPERRGVVTAVTKQFHDFRKTYGLAIAEPVPRVFCRIPGNQALSLSVEEKQLAIPELPDALVGLKIAQLSDLHISGRFGIEIYREVVEITNRWKPDLVALTGDLIEKDRCHDWIAETYARLEAPLGVTYVLGNHDKKCDHATTRRRLDAAGLIDVSRHATSVIHNGAAVEIVGNELPWFGPPSDFSDESTAMRLVLAHSPDQFDWAVARDAHLMLAGHNHGGQVRLPPLGALLTPSIHGTRYNCGAFRKADTVMHVTRGTGSLAPLRFFCPPELSLLVLEKA